MKDIKYAESYLKRASNRLDDAKNSLKKRRYPESVSASQECIELSIKSIFLLIGKEFKKKHKFTEGEYKEVLEKIPKEVEWRNFNRLYLLSCFWSEFYTVSKYGYDKLKAGPETLFKESEAKLGLEHADECYHATNHLLQISLRRRREKEI